MSVTEMDRHTDYFILDGNAKRKDILATVEKFLADNNGECFSKLTMRKGHCGGEEEAKSWLAHYRQGDRTMFEAVKFIIRTEIEPSEEENRLADIAEDAHDKWKDLEDGEYLDTIEFDRFRCPHCECEFPHDLIIKRVHYSLGSNKCPMCREDYRPKEILDEIERLKNDYYAKERDWYDVNLKRRNEERAQDTYKWAVRVEWYPKTEYQL